MRDLLKILIAGVIMFVSPFVSAETYKVLVVPDNIATETSAIDAYIYNATSEFFANEIINLLNSTDNIDALTVSEERNLLKNNPACMIPARNLTNKFKTTYNIDHAQLKKITNYANARYALMLTSTIDAENYILRRTVWDFLNIPGATVIDPAYKISTYAALVDTQNSQVLWSNTFYKTISVLENRIISRGPSPQTEQLQKIRDYSRMICPEIAKNVQQNVLPPEVYSSESKQIYYDMGNFDNVFTKKYRRWYQEGGKNVSASKSNVTNKVDSAKNKYQEYKKQKEDEKALKKQMEQLEVKAEPVEQKDYKIEPLKPANPTKVTKQDLKEDKIFNINFKKQEKKLELEDQSLFESIDIKRTKKNNLYGEFDNSRPPLRDYN